MKNQFKARLIIITFGLFLIIPTMIYPFINKYLDKTNYENRNLASRPSLSGKSLLDFPTSFDNWYNDHIPYKNEMIQLNSTMNFKLFNTIESDNVILGKDDWLFYKGENGMAIDAYEASNLYSDGELKKILNNVIGLRNQIKENTGAEFVLMLIPDKEHMYEEYLPEYITTESDYKRVDQLYDYITNNSDIKVCYTLESLNSVKDKYQTYYKYDTHWNKVGGFFGTLELLKTIGEELLTQEVPELVESPLFDGGLAIMARLEATLNNDEYYTVNNYLEEVLVEEEKCENNYNGELFKFNSNSSNKETMYFYGDSFRKWMIPYLQNNYEQTIFNHRMYFKMEDLIKEEPDIVVFQYVERYSWQLLDLKY